MYNCYNQTDRASGGSSIAIYNRFKLKTNLEAVAIRLSLHKTITLCIWEMAIFQSYNGAQLF